MSALNLSTKIKAQLIFLSFTRLKNGVNPSLSRSSMSPPYFTKA